MRQLLRLCCIGIVCLCLSALVVFAQSAATATLTGQVADPQGAVIPNAKVIATSVATGVAHSVNTTSTGNYTLPNLPPGTYNVTVQAPKFTTGEAKGITLNVGDQRDLGFKLAVAGTTESVEVTTTAPLIETTKTDVSTSVTDLDMEKLPTFAPASGGANDFAQLALTAPGVKFDPTLSGDLIGPGSLNNRGNLYNVDGANITDQMVSGRDGIGASVDEIQEFQVLTNNYNAEYGQAGGLIINAVTKSGGNQVHGEGHMLFRGRNFESNDPFYNVGLFQNAVPHSVAGPHPCPDSDFDASGTLTKLDGCDRAPFHRKEGGFTIGGPFIKDKLFWFGGYELSRQGFPLTLTPPSGAITIQQPTNNLLWSGKVDYHISNNHNMTFRYNVDRLLQDNLIVQTGSNITPDSLTSNVTHVNGMNVALVSNLTPTLVNDVHFSFQRTLTLTPDKTTLPGQQHPSSYTGAAFCCPQGGLQKRYQYLDNLTWSHGKHTWKGGANISYFPWYSLFQQFHFGQWGDFINPTTPGSFTFGSGPGQVTSKDNIYGLYFQDTWKLRRNLTVNYGIRYDMEAGAFKGGTIKGPNGTCFQANGLIPACSSDHNNWQPRLGITWEVRPGTLVKAAAAEVTMLAFNNVVLDSRNFDGVNLNTTLVSAATNPAQWPTVLAAFPNAPSPTLLASLVPPGSGRFGLVRPISDHLHNPEMHMFNLSLQHQFTKTLVGEAQYIGQFGSGLFGERDTNTPPVIADPNHAGFFYYGDRPNPHFTKVRTNENSRTSHYNGLLLSATKRMSNHVQFNGSYTWSHALTSSEDFFGLSEPGDPRNIRAELGPALNDIRHAANIGVVLDSGKWTDRSIVRWFTNDLTLGIIGQLQSGRPYPVSTGTAGYANARFFGNGNETQQRPNVLPDGTLSSAGIASAFQSNALFGPGAVALCSTPIASGGLGFSAAQCGTIGNTFLAPAGASPLGAADALTGDVVDFRLVNGNLERNAGRGAPFLRNDMSLKKQFRIAHTENVKLELEADAINVFNRSNWLGNNSNDVVALPLGGNALSPAGQGFFDCTGCMRPNGTYIGNNGSTLKISDLRSGRVSKDFLNPRFAQNPAFGSNALSGIGDPASTDGPRKFQLAFRVRF